MSGLGGPFFSGGDFMVGRFQFRLLTLVVAVWMAGGVLFLNLRPNFEIGTNRRLGVARFRSHS
jgi:hypothetical protein